jgi:hypothetical protein
MGNKYWLFVDAVGVLEHGRCAGGIDLSWCSNSIHWIWSRDRISDKIESLMK